jgi:hypothetical protein
VNLFNNFSKREIETTFKIKALKGDPSHPKRAVYPDEYTCDGSRPQAAVALSRVAIEVNAKLQEGSASSTEFMRSVVSELKKLTGPQTLNFGINCFLDAAHYFYLIGQSFSAIEPSV